MEAFGEFVTVLVTMLVVIVSLTSCVAMVAQKLERNICEKNLLRTQTCHMVAVPKPEGE
jgi:hypothetical protein